MSFFRSSRILTGYSSFGAPPVAVYEFDPPDSNEPAKVPSARMERLDSFFGFRSNGTALASRDFIDGFAELFLALMRLVDRSAAVRGRRVNPLANTIQLFIACDHGEVAEEVARVSSALLFDRKADLEDASLLQHLDRLKQLAGRHRINADALALRDVALARNLPVRWLDQDPFNPPPPDDQSDQQGDDQAAPRLGLLQLGHGVRQRRVFGFMPMPTGATGPVNVLDRQTLMSRLISAGLPVPRQDLEFPNKNSLPRLTRAAERIGYPVVVRSAHRRPFADWHGGGMQFGPIEDSVELARAFDSAGQPRHGVWIEAFVSGDRYRFIVIGGVLRAVRSGTDAESATGTRPVVAPDAFSTEIRALAEKAARTVGLVELAAVEMALVDPSGPAAPGNCAVTEVYPDPRVIEQPAPSGQPGEACAAQADGVPDPAGSTHALADALVDTLFPSPDSARVPILAVTGTNGKTTTSRMLARILRREYRRVGLATTDGAFINDDLLGAEEASGVDGGCLVLAEPDVDAAVLETARGDLFRYGTAFDTCDVAACLNVSADHLGCDGIETVDQMATVKSRLLRRATKAVVVNADDPRCLGMLEQVTCERHVLVAASAANTAVQRHLAAGGEAVFDEPGPDGRWIVLAHGDRRRKLIDQNAIPATMNGLLGFNQANARHAAAVAWSFGVDMCSIRAALGAFDHTHTINPGRFNFFPGYRFTAMLDFAHNPAGVHGVLELIESLDIRGKRHLVCLTIGARHKAHIEELAGDLAQAFDTFTLGCYRVNVERNPEYASDSPVDEMLALFKRRLIEQGVPAGNVATHVERADAIRAGLERANAGDLLVVLGHPDVSIPILASSQAAGVAAAVPDC